MVKKQRESEGGEWKGDEEEKGINHQGNNTPQENTTTPTNDETIELSEMHS